MDKIMKFVKLDFITIKPYMTLKNLLIYGGIIVVLAVANRTASMALMVVMWFSLIFSTYPFAVGDQNGIDALYMILGLERKLVVRGRYSFLILMDIMGVVLALVTYLVLALVLQEPFAWAEALTSIAAIILVLSFGQFFQYPIFFKNGYTKAKWLAYFPFVLIGAASLLIINLGNAFPNMTENIVTFVEGNAGLSIIGLFVFWVLTFTISYRISCKVYEKREF